MTFEALHNDMVAAMKACDKARKAVMPALKGKADGKAINAIVAGLCQ